MDNEPFFSITPNWAIDPPKYNTLIPKSAQCECERVMLTRFVKP